MAKQKNQTKETWKDTGFLNIQVSNKCRFREAYGNGTFSNFAPKFTRKETGYIRVQLDKVRTLHLLIANLFVPNPDNLPQVNHKDGDKGNNNANNLEWVTIKQNCLHSHYVLGNESSKPKRPVNIYLNGKLRKKAESVAEAARFANTHTTIISKCCKGNTPFNGYLFEYIKSA